MKDDLREALKAFCPLEITNEADMPPGSTVYAVLCSLLERLAVNPPEGKDREVYFKALESLDRRIAG